MVWLRHIKLLTFPQPSAPPGSDNENGTAAMTAPVHISATVTGHGDASLRTAYLWLAAASGALGGLLFGYDWVVIGGAKPFYEIYFHLTSPKLQGWAMSCALLGCLAGAVAAGSLSDRFGRKRLLTVSALTFATSSLGDALVAHFIVFVTWRILGGFAIGLASGVSPMYIAEVSPAHLRGRLVSLNQFAIVIGILLAQVVNWLIARPCPPAPPPPKFFSPGAARRPGAGCSALPPSLRCSSSSPRSSFPKARDGWLTVAATSRPCISSCASAGKVTPAR